MRVTCPDSDVNEPVAQRPQHWPRLSCSGQQFSARFWKSKSWAFGSSPVFWGASPVVALSDGNIIGVFCVTPNGSLVSPLYETGVDNKQVKKGGFESESENPGAILQQPLR